LHPRVLRRLDVKGPTAGFELFLDRLPQPKARGKGQGQSSAARPLLQASPYQPVERDFAFVVDAAVPAEKLIRAAKGADKTLIQSVALFDVFEGGALGAGKKSLAFSVTLQAPDRTLTDQEIAAVSERIVAAVTKATGGTLRT
jgi:phenylalanyl-tRNA synthetase beta chain